MIRELVAADRNRVRAIFVALLALLFVAAPMLDSLLCSGEASATELSIGDTTSGGIDHTGVPDIDSHCIHGHCHHLTPMPSAVVVDHAPHDEALKVAWRSSRIDSLEPSSLERPPRV